MNELRRSFDAAVRQLPEFMQGLADDRRSYLIDGRWKLCAADGSELRAAPAATRAAPQHAPRALPESLARTMPGRETPGEIQALRKFAAANRVRLTYNNDTARWEVRS